MSRSMPTATNEPCRQKTNADGYTPPMNMRIVIKLLLALLIFSGARALAADLTLLTIEHMDRGKPTRTEVLAKLGDTTSPLRGKGLEKIRVLPGNALVANQQPNDAIVDLYRGGGIEGGLLCSINVRYFRDARGLWVPHFQLIEEAMVMRGPDGRWRPLNIARGAPSLIVMTGTSLPNPEGFYPTLEFGLTIGLLQIDAWTVRQ